MNGSIRVLCATTAILAAPAAAAETPAARYDQVRLEASAGREIATDTALASMYMEHQSQQQSTAADEVNRGVRWALEQARAAGVEATTSTYRTQPVYRDRRIAGWRVLQSIELRSTEPGRLAPLLGDLQSRLAIESLRNVLSPEALAAAEEALIADALAAFQRRARLIAETLGRPGYRIVSLDVGTSAARPPPGVVMRAAAADSAAVAAPAIEAGDQRVEVRVAGTIELDAQP